MLHLKSAFQFILLCLFSSLEISASPYMFSQLNSENGLISNHINTIFKDSEGFVWFGTTYGLSRWDGYSFMNISDGKTPYQLPDHKISSIQEDGNGDLWIQMTADYVRYTRQGILEPVKTSFFKDFPTHATIKYVHIDEQKAFWVISSENKLYHYAEPDAKPLVLEFTGDGDAIDIATDSLSCWVIFKNGVIEKYNKEDLTIQKCILSLKDRYNEYYEDFRIVADIYKNLWFYSFRGGIGLYRIHTESDSVIHYSTHSPLALSSNEVNSIVPLNEKEYWIGTDHGGLNILNLENNTVRHITHKKGDALSIAQNSITSLYKDPEGIIWIGTYKRGISYYHPETYKFSSTGYLDELPPLPFSDINCFAEEPGKALWIGSNGYGLVRFDYQKKTLRHFKHNPADKNSLSSDIIISLNFENNQLWVCTYLGGLSRYNGTNFERVKIRTSSSNTPPIHSVWRTLRDSDNRLWVATFKEGLYYSVDKNKFLPVDAEYTNHDIMDKFSTCLFERRNKELLVGTCNGVFVVDSKHKKVRSLTGTTQGSSNLSNNQITALLEDEKGLIWIGTESGLDIFDPAADTLYHIRKEEGLSDHTIRSLQEDNENKIWSSSLKGISEITASLSDSGKWKFKIRNFSKSEGLLDDEFNQNASLKNANGRLFFGGPSGINHFLPQAIQTAFHPLSLRFTNFRLYGKQILADSIYNGHVILPQLITKTKELVLQHNENDFSLDFSGMNYFNPEKISFEYLLKGYRSEWVRLPEGIHSVEFTNLNPGKYELLIRSTNEKDPSRKNPLTLSISILPPFWKTGWAYLLYILTCISLLVLIYRRIKQRIRFDKILRENAHQQELEEMRLRFFTDISHELRTPLSLILAPVENLLQKEQSPENKDQLDMIQRNAYELKNLVDKILELRRIEKGIYELHTNEEDLVLFLRETGRTFKSLALQKEIYYVFNSSLSTLTCSFDSEKVQIIINNLLSNAFKFTPQGGHVEVSMTLEDVNSGLQVVIKVRDTGVGIQEEDKEQLFERFFQGKLPTGHLHKGSGIGLNLAWKYATLMGGTLDVESKAGEGAIFTLSFPCERSIDSQAIEGFVQGGSVQEEIQQNDLLQEVYSIAEEGNEPHSFSKEKTELPVLLIAEDNSDFRSLIRQEFKTNYQIIEAQDGKEALELIHDRIPDLIISDLMMPEMNGLQLCKAIRSDIRTSHIPFILLTAKHAVESMIEGYETGADEYITKPFRMDILVLRTRKLMEFQKKIHQEINVQLSNNQPIEVKPRDIKIRSLDEKLIERAVNIIEEKMSDPDFTVEELSKMLGMSRVYLYKKILALTGKTPIEMIRVMRLKRASQLLGRSQLSVSEIAYQVGFNNPKYFTKYFKEEYNMLPSEYIRRYQEENPQETNIPFIKNNELN